jgi:nucleotidyltransferase substrate binding protein (TIGR01987 family)
MRLENFRLALDSLEEFVVEPQRSKRDLAGTVFGFMIAFDLAWKCAQDEIILRGYEERGPKLALKAAFAAGLIDPLQEASWSQMLEDRNLAAHIYDQEFALAVTRRIAVTHLRALKGLYKTLAEARS